MQRTDAKYTKALSMAKIISRDKTHVFLRMKQARQRDRERDSDKSAEMSVNESDGEAEMTEAENLVASDDSGGEAFEDTATQSQDVSKTLRSFQDWLLSPDWAKRTGKQQSSTFPK